LTREEEQEGEDGHGIGDNSKSGEENQGREMANWRLMRWPGVSLATMTRSIRAVIILHLWATATENCYGREPQ
jgi:hypothetical protein